MIALPFLEQTSNIVTDTDTNPHFARILRNTTNIRPTLAPKEPEVNETTSTLKHEASTPRSSSSSWYHGCTPASSGPPSTVSTPELNLRAPNVLQHENSVLDNMDSSSSINGPKSRISFRPARSGTGMRIEHPGAEILWRYLTDAVRADTTLPSDSRKMSTTVVQCLCDVMLAVHMPAELLKLLPDDSGSVLMQQILKQWDFEVEEDASDLPDYEDYTMFMAALRSDLPKLCAGLHWYIADIVLRHTIERFGGILAMVLRNQTHIEQFVYVWVDLGIIAQLLTADTSEEENFFQSIKESTKHYVIPLILLGACREYKSARESHDRLTACLEFFLNQNEETFAPDDKLLVPKDWIDDALEALANGVSRYAVYLRGVAQQAALNLQRDGGSASDGDSEIDHAAKSAGVADGAGAAESKGDSKSDNCPEEAWTEV